MQPLIVAALFAVPPAAAVGAFAAIAALAVAVPVAAVLSVERRARVPGRCRAPRRSVTIAYFVAMVGGAIAVWRPRRPDEDAGAAPGSGSSAA